METYLTYQKPKKGFIGSILHPYYIIGSESELFLDGNIVGRRLRDVRCRDELSDTGRSVRIDVRASIVYYAYIGSGYEIEYYVTNLNFFDVVTIWDIP